MQSTFRRARLRALSAGRALRRRLQYGSLPEPAETDLIMPGGIAGIEEYFNRRERPYRNAKQAIPDVRLDLQAVKHRRLTVPSAPVPRRATSDACVKYRDLCCQFAGQSELLALHALVCALLRRRGCPPRYRRLFLRTWHEEGAFLAASLNTRWLISAATSFADAGGTTEQRVAGQAFALVFDLIKLHDSERSLSGRPNSLAFAPNAKDDRFPLAFGLRPYSFSKGDLDLSILSRLGKLAKSDPVFEPLGEQLMAKLMSDNRSVFARTQMLKPPKRRQRSGAG